MNRAILSAKHPQFAASLREYGYEIIQSETIPCNMPYERDHADLQCLIHDDTVFVLSCCTRLTEALSRDYHVISCGERFSGSYPDNTCLSAVTCGDKLIGRIASLDEKIKAYCHDHEIELIHVNQGYAKCSCVQIADNAVITADNGIIRVLQNTEIDVLPIGKGSIRLDGAEYGFLGGASGYDRDKHTVYFCGDIDRHPDSERIKRFCEIHHTKVISLSEDELTDIGGIIFC
ncbi:DUF6873 family GME fold protein [Ruminococcus sp.]|uniref:DUF6873 family GME fold protein n=1 Tax=Ruminococcus sp. TaxID=41978 RepID=UPI002E8039A5|nr:hypothetical protein [Ruminococcus sp.]MEE3493063.1 hypothetical protein [Ruminococcus sp.]